MKKYYYTDGKEKYGPFTIIELRQYNLTRETLVWFEGISDWQAAGNIPELGSLFSSNAPPPVASASPPNFQVETPMNNKFAPKTWLVESILVTIFCCLPFGIAGIVNAAKVESRFRINDFDGAMRSSLEAKKWTMIGFWAGLIGGGIYLIIVFFAVLSEGGF